MLGKTFTRAAWQRSRASTRDEVQQLVDSLMRKELLAIDTDPFSPERGQLGFLQALVQRVTYETIAQARPPGAPSRGGPLPGRPTPPSTPTRSPR